LRKPPVSIHRKRGKEQCKTRGQRTTYFYPMRIQRRGEEDSSLGRAGSLCQGWGEHGTNPPISSAVMEKKGKPLPGGEPGTLNQVCRLKRIQFPRKRPQRVTERPLRVLRVKREESRRGEGREPFLESTSTTPKKGREQNPPREGPCAPSPVKKPLGIKGRGAPGKKPPFKTKTRARQFQIHGEEMGKGGSRPAWSS